MQTKQTNETTLGQLIERWLEPVKGREAQVQMIRCMTQSLGMGPDSIRGFPRTDVVKDEIKRRLSIRLLETVEVKPGDLLTYFPRSCSWGSGQKCKVLKVNRTTLTLDDGQNVNSKCVPLYCLELLKQVGANVDFADLQRKTAALFT